jgi:hypothetical protein
MRRGGSAAPAAAPPRAAGALYRVTVATSESSTLAPSATGGAPCAFLCARGAGGAPLGPWPLARAPGSGLPPPLARSSADAFVVAAPRAAAAAAGPLTHITLWTEAPRAGAGAAAGAPAGGAPPPTAAARAAWRAALGGGHSHSSSGGGEWHVRWVTIEELPSNGDGDSDDEEEEEESEEDEDDDDVAQATHARAPRPGRRTFFFAVDQVRAPP